MAKPRAVAASSVWIWFAVAAVVFGTLHILLDLGVGLFQLSGPATLPQIGALSCISLVYGWWALSLVKATSTTAGLLRLAVVDVGWVVLANGSSVVFCAFPCPSVAPLGDIAHVGSLVFGAAAALTAVLEARSRREPPDWRLAAVGVVLVLASYVALATAAAPASS